MNKFPKKSSREPDPLAGTKPRKSFARRSLKTLFLGSIAFAAAGHIYVMAFGILPSPRTWTMTGRVMAGETLQRKNVKIDDVSPFLIAAVIAAEDARFCSHNGIDREAIEKAIEHNKKGGRRRGGSTITQQTSKNLFFWNGGGMARKAGEAYTAILIDALWSKETILQHYLNIAEWGDGIFGAEAAAQARFGKSASALNSYEAALLASVLPSPNKWRVNPPSAFVSKRAATINARLKVTAREGYGDCVLLGHPAYNRKDFGARSPNAPTETLPEMPDDIPSELEEAANVPEPRAEPPATSLNDVLTQAETAAQIARDETDGALEDTAQPAETEIKANDEAPTASPQNTIPPPRDIRPEALKNPTPEDADNKNKPETNE